MKNILLIGLGRFGRHLAMELNRLGHQIMAVDRDEERVNECMPFVTNAQIGDSTRLEFCARSALGIMTSAMLPSAAAFRILWRQFRFSKSLAQKPLSRVRIGTFRKSFCFATARTTSPIPKNSLPNGRPPATPPTICSTTLSWTTDMPLWRSPSRNDGSVRPSAS